MGAFLYGACLQWKLDFRNKGVVITYYVVPLVFFAFMGGIFTSINPVSKNTLIQSMTVFAVTMGAILGTPAPLIEQFQSDIKKAYKVGNIPLWIGIVNNAISAFVHMMIVSTIIYFVAPIAFGATVPQNPPTYFLSVSLFLIATIGIGTLLGITVKSATKLTMVSQLIFLPSIMLSGIMFPADFLPNILRNAGKVFPATWGYIGMSEGLGFANVLPLFIICLLTTFFVCLYYQKLKQGE